MKKRSETGLAKVWTVIPWCQPGGFGIWNGAGLSWDLAMKNALLPCNDADPEALIMWSFEDLVAMKTKKGFCGILSGWGKTK